MTPNEICNSPAIISECGLYRYSLTRAIHPGLPPALFVMLNPSTADDKVDDPTIRRCVNFALRWGYGGIIVVNLFAYRTTDPREICVADDPVGPENDECLRAAALAAYGCGGIIVCAWGARGKLVGRGQEVGEMMSVYPLHALGLTKHGEPKHPLYLPSGVFPVEWEV